MVQKASPGSGRGRPREFDADAVVDAAIGAFFAKGLDGTTLSDLETATGVDRSTLYNSFGGKKGLYHQATARYLERAADGLFKPLHEGSDDGLADIEEFLGYLRSGLTEVEVSPGCLVVNDMAAGADPDAATRYRALLEGGLRKALSRAADAGAVAADMVDARAGTLASAVIGINLISGHTGDPREVARLVEAAVNDVRSWDLRS